MNIALPPELKRLVEAKLKTGLYHTASEVIREGLRLLEERDRYYELRLAALRRDVGKGLAQLDAGQGRTLDTAALKRRLNAEFGRAKEEGQRQRSRNGRKAK